MDFMVFLICVFAYLFLLYLTFFFNLITFFHFLLLPCILFSDIPLELIS